MSDGGAKPGQPDPSMEDILASIRKILNEDEAQESGPPDVVAAPPAPEASLDEPLVLTEEMLLDPAPVVVVAEPTPAPPPAPPAASPAPQPPPPPTPAPLADAEGLIAPATAAAAAASLGLLSQAVARDRLAGVTRGGATIEDVVREELRPLLKEWLDAHLAPMVERMVEAEIERVMRR